MGKAIYDCANCKATFTTKGRLVNHTCHNFVPIKEELIDVDEKETYIEIKLEPTDFLASNLESFGNIDANNGEAFGKYISGAEDPLSVEVKEEIISIEMTVEEESLPVPVENKNFTNGKHIKYEECNKKFKNRVIYNSHIKSSSHNMFKPYKCSVCNQKFLLKQCLQMHMRVHMREGHYPCHICPNTYHLKTSYTIHMGIHHGEKMYVCGVCFKKCYDQSGLACHMQSHICTLCNVFCATQSSITDHINIHHSANVRKALHEINDTSAAPVGTTIDNITTSGPPLERKKSIFKLLGFREPVDRHLKNKKTGFTSNRFKEGQKIIVEKQGLVLKGLPTLNNEYSANLSKVCFVKFKNSLANNKTITQDTQSCLFPNSDQLLHASKNTLATKSNTGINNQPSNNSRLIVPGKVAVQPMFCLGRNNRKK